MNPLSTKPPFTVWVDLDGVVFDFNRHFTDLTGITWFGDKSRMSSAQKWALVNQHPTFFRDLPPMPGLDRFWKFLEPFDPWILTAANPRVPHCREQKIEACKETLGISDDRIVIVDHRTKKTAYCKPPYDLLIDDRADNIERWQDGGGWGILFVDVDQTIAELSAIPHVREFLRGLCQ